MSRNLIDDFGLTYDYGSIMHYNEMSCSINKQRTMVAIDPFYQKTMGSDLISFSDIFMINKHYECDGQRNAASLRLLSVKMEDFLALETVPFVFAQVVMVALCVVSGHQAVEKSFRRQTQKKWSIAD
uniref:Metalloendopeptidase n=1 Tax=Angiostrongylus cantonensis TaxID=6313 RepID=A0A0K0DNM7_ANGCA